MTKAAKVIFVGDMAEFECREDLVKFLMTLQDDVSSIDVSDQLIRGVLSSVRPVVAISYPADDLIIAHHVLMYVCIVGIDVGIYEGTPATTEGPNFKHS